ncbi:MAG: FHA domain-containing protein [Actinomycetota bacterium]|nr:MAG: FHA domain-containing protein [Actinomycetota bacterium]
MARECLTCGTVAADDDRYCSNCGAVLPAPSEPESAAESTGMLGGPDSGPLSLADAAGLAVGDQAAALVVRRGPGEGTQFSLAGDLVSVGRAPDADVFLDDITVSRRHAEFRHDDLGWSVHDVGSLNGTYVNRARIEQQRLALGDEVQIGKYRFLFLEPQAPDRVRLDADGPTG